MRNIFYIIIFLDLNMNILHPIKFKISVVILFQIFYNISSTTSFRYPYSITLVSDNILLIQKTGIDIYDKSLNKLNQIIEFSGEDKITEENFSRIAIKYNNEYILSVINDKMFIFNNEGYLLYKSEEKINSNQTIYSYSLTFIHVTNNTCDYVIGYFDEDCFLNLYLYRYDIEINNITLLSKCKQNSYLHQITESYETGTIEFTYKQKLLSCEYMYSNLFSNDYNLLICFFNSDANVGIVAYNIIEYKNNEIVQFLGLHKDYIYILTQNIDNNKNITSIKSELNNHRNMAIVWWNFKDNNQTRYFIYDLEYTLFKSNWKFNFNKEYLYSWKLLNTCINTEYEERINIFPYKDQFAFSCIIEDENIQILLYNKTNLMNDSYIINTFCENNNELSKLYFNDNKNYLIYQCFKNCSDKKFENDTDCLNERENEENIKKNDKKHDEENKGNDDEENKRGNKENKKMNIIMVIIIIVIVIIFLIVFIIIFIEYFKNNKFEKKWQKVKEDEKLMKDTLSDLIPK